MVKTTARAKFYDSGSKASANAGCAFGIGAVICTIALGGVGVYGLGLLLPQAIPSLNPLSYWDSVMVFCFLRILRGTLTVTNQ